MTPDHSVPGLVPPPAKVVGWKAPMPCLLALLCASLIGNVFFGLKLAQSSRLAEVRLAAPDQVAVIRTKGGLLQVSTLKSTETFQSTRDHAIFFGLGHLGTTVTQIRVPAVFNYHIELAPEWKVTLRDKTFIVVAPAVKPSLPVAIDTAKLERFSSGAWSFFTGPKELDILQRSITQTLAAKAVTPGYIDYQRNVARQTVTEFVQKWLVSQSKWQSAQGYSVRVFFADESISALGADPLPLAKPL
jgi:hypothetical protein